MFRCRTGKPCWKNNHRLNGLTVLPRVGAPLLLLTFTELSGARGPASSWTHIRFSSSQAGPQHFSTCLFLCHLSVWSEGSWLVSHDWSLRLIYFGIFVKTVLLLLSHIVALVVIVTVTSWGHFCLPSIITYWDCICDSRIPCFLSTAVWTGWRPKEERVSGWPLQFHAKKRYVTNLLSDCCLDVFNCFYSEI